MTSSSPSLGVRWPLMISAMANIMGYFRSIRYPPSLALISSTRAVAVATPSATSDEDASMSSTFSPRPSRTPKARLRERGPKQVPNRSPAPDKPEKVDALAPIFLPNRRISIAPDVTMPLIALVPRSSPSHIPAAMARTFLTAPPISTPITSLLVNTWNISPLRMFCSSRASRLSVEATTTPVARPLTISRANEGPDRKA
mmetsp:Transcript_44516/g.110804  ORF Transcript_44516/g.110804 Transcript_44516/m.110804 type:complete len:200 (+) Transcript_44516:77-676(+)